MFPGVMHTYRFAAALFAVVAATGCDHKAKPKDNLPSQPSPDPTPNAANKPTDDMKPEPVGKDPGSAAQPTPTPAAPAATGDVRPPVAADLAEYTKGLPGNGSKLMMKMETSMGTFNCELYGDKAPATVANFIGLATGKKPWTNPKLGKTETGTPYFNGLMFHRVIPGFMIQGGDPTGSGMGGPGYNFDDEIWNGQQIVPGVLAMANAGVRGGHGTNGSQFFVMKGRREDLDKKHTVFGKCNEIELIDKIAGVPRDDGDKPQQPVTIKTITITKG